MVLISNRTIIPVITAIGILIFEVGIYSCKIYKIHTTVYYKSAYFYLFYNLDGSFERSSLLDAEL